MKSIMMKIAPVVFALVAGSAWAHGDVKCPPHPKAEWKPHNDLYQKLVKEGWQVRRMEVSPTCYEVYAKDPQGKRIEAFFDPVTFERVEEE